MEPEHAQREERMETLPAAQAVESLIHEYGNLVFHTIHALTGDWELSQDLTQETFLSALKAIDAAREVSGPHFHARAWLMRIALNVVRMQRRRNALIRLVPFSQVQREDDEEGSAGLDGVQVHASLVQPAGYGAKLPVDPADVVPEREAVRCALAGVPETLRIPLLLSIVGGFSISEIAGILQLREAAVRQRLSRARKAFGQCYAQESGEVVRVAQTDHRKSSDERRPACHLDDGVFARSCSMRSAPTGVLV
jgi:RNA polymerase sigma-70 factor, ECF subfamily